MTASSMAHQQLVRLQLPARWAVCNNSFGDEKMVVVDGWIENSHCYQEDLLWLQSLRSTDNEGSPYELDPTGWVVDVGWYPAGDPTGAYSLHVIRVRADQLYWPLDPPRFRSPSRSLVRAVIEHLLIMLGDRNETEESVRQRLAELQGLEEQEKLGEFLGVERAPQ